MNRIVVSRQVARERWGAATVAGLLMALLVSLSCMTSFAAPFRNTSNHPWGSRCNGPQGAIVVDDAVGRPSGLSAAGGGAHFWRAASSVELLQRLGLTNRRARAVFPRVRVHTSGGSLVLPRASEAPTLMGSLAAGNDLSFTYEGWSAAEQATLEAYLARAYPVAKEIYGAPALSQTVKIVRDDTVSDLQGGIYDLSLGEIHLPSLSGSFDEDSFVLMLCVLHAFRGAKALYYDAWEDGMAGAAATAVQATPGVSPGFNPYDPGPFYCLSVYECENQPALAGPTFYPTSGFTGMLVWRIAMARAAWLKCYIEDPGFFARFNEAYYAGFTEGLQGDVPALRSVCSSVLGQVEGMSFDSWFERQYVLDTSVHTGLKLFTWNVPLESSVALIAEYFSSDSDGDESPRGGAATTKYWDYTLAQDLFSEEGNTITIPAAGSSAGEGYLVPAFNAIGGPQRITVQVDLGSLQQMLLYPYGERDFTPGANSLYGATVGGTEGTVELSGDVSLSGVSAARGVFAGSVGGALSPGKLTVSFTNAAGQQFTRSVNVGWDAYCLLLEGGQQSEASHTWEAGLHLISLPVTPSESDVPTLLGVPPSDLLLARWDPTLAPAGAYRIWPDIDPITPGRGFWLKLFSPTTVTLSGAAPAAESSFTIELKPGWNMIGSPRTVPVALSTVTVDDGSGTSMTLGQAVSTGLIQAGIFRYDDSAGYQAVDQLAAFEGVLDQVSESERVPARDTGGRLGG